MKRLIALTVMGFCCLVGTSQIEYFELVPIPNAIEQGQAVNCPSLGMLQLFGLTSQIDNWADCFEPDSTYPVTAIHNTDLGTIRIQGQLHDNDAGIISISLDILLENEVLASDWLGQDSANVLLPQGGLGTGISCSLETDSVTVFQLNPQSRLTLHGVLTGELNMHPSGTNNRWALGKGVLQPLCEDGLTGNFQWQGIALNQGIQGFESAWVAMCANRSSYTIGYPDSGNQSCGEGTHWDDSSQSCVVVNSSDADFDGCVGASDLLSLLSLFGAGCGNNQWHCGEPLVHFDTEYGTILIGDQCWFSENLNTQFYANGDVIPTAPENVNWINGTFGGMVTVYSDAEGECFHYSPTINACDASQSVLEYGRLYNKDAVYDVRGLCPTGWHVATEPEFEMLQLQFGAEPLKAIDGWYQDLNGNNESGFDANPNGMRNGNTGQLINAGYQANWWSQGSGYWYMNHTSSNLNHGTTAPGGVTNRFGFAVRCVQDAE